MAPAGGRPPKAPDEGTYAGRLGARLRALREAAGRTVGQQRNALEEAGWNVKVPTVRAWERGDRTPPVDALRPLAGTFGVSVEKLLPPG